MGAVVNLVIAALVLTAAGNLVKGLRVSGFSPDLDVQGNILDHEYEIKEGRRKVTQVSKKWFRVRDTYRVEVAPDHDDVLILAVTVALDNMAHPSK